MNSLRGDYFLESSDAAAAATLSSIPTFTRSSISRVLCWPLAILKLFKKLISVYSKCPSCPSIFWGKGLVYQIFKKIELHVVLSRPVSVIFFVIFYQSHPDKRLVQLYSISHFTFSGAPPLLKYPLLWACSSALMIHLLINYNLFLKK